MKSTQQQLKITNRRMLDLSQGMSLVEILVTVFILSVGLLGIAATQAIGVSNNHDSYLRSQATMLVNELTERMSLNIQEVDNNNFDINAFDMTTCGTPPAAICEGPNVANQCTRAQLATYDIYRIACGYDAGAADGIVNIFPNSTLNITCIDSDGGVDADPCTDGSNHRITITWQKPNGVAMDTNQVQILVRP